MIFSFFNKDLIKNFLALNFYHIKIENISQAAFTVALPTFCLNFQEKLMTVTIDNSLKTSLETESQAGSN